MLPADVSVPGVCAIAEASRNETKIKAAMSRALILCPFGFMAYLA